MNENLHSFHIPVMGLAFTVDSPIKVAAYGISSVISLSDDSLLDDMNAHYSMMYDLGYEHIPKKDHDARARRVTAYLNSVNRIVNQRFESLKHSGLGEGSELRKYIGLLPEDAPLKKLLALYERETDELSKKALEHEIMAGLRAGAIEVNIMTKLDKTNYAADGSVLGPEFSDAMAALRGFANSEVNSSVVFSAGFNPKLYAYIEQFPDFFPDEKGTFKKKITLKVSDFRSAMIQGRYLAKKGVWISEFRMESGLNCGGHAFATDGYLMGPILEEFKTKREELRKELFGMCETAWKAKNISVPSEIPPVRLTVQGGIGTANENNFLLNYYKVDSTGWGTPFLLVPEATTVDEATLQMLVKARSEDLYLSDSSPLGVPFNNLRSSFSDRQRLKRIAGGRPGSPCLKQHLVSSTEFTEEAICTASRQYQHHKLQELKAKDLCEEEYQKAYEQIVVKACLCEDLSASAYINNKIESSFKTAPAICPGPNLAYFSGIYSLKEMVDHIYGRGNIMQDPDRPHVFINELKMYIEYLQKEIRKQGEEFSKKKAMYFETFKANLLEGISYYKNLIPQIKQETADFLKKMRKDLERLENVLIEVELPFATETA